MDVAANHYFIGAGWGNLARLFYWRTTLDNQTINAVSEGEEGILAALSIIWSAAAIGGKAKHYKVVKLKESLRYYGAKNDRTDRPNLSDNLNGVPGVHVHHFSNSVVTKDDDKEGITTLILFWHEEQGSIQLPFPLDQKQSAQFIADWLEQTPCGPRPDIDGDCAAGWRLFTEHWGHVAGHHYAIIAAQPCWAMYCK